MNSLQRKEAKIISDEEVLKTKNVKELRDKCLYLLKTRDELVNSNLQLQSRYKNVQNDGQLENQDKFSKLETIENKYAEFSEKILQILDSDESEDNEKIMSMKDLVLEMNTEISSSKSDFESSKVNQSKNQPKHEVSYFEKKYNFQCQVNKKIVEELTEIRKENAKLHQKVDEMSASKGSASRQSESRNIYSSPYSRTPRRTLTPSSARTTRRSSVKTPHSNKEGENIVSTPKAADFSEENELSQTKSRLIASKNDVKESESHRKEVRERLIAKRKEYEKELKESESIKRKIKERIKLYEKQIDSVSVEIKKLKKINSEGKKKLRRIEDEIEKRNAAFAKKKEELQKSIENNERIIAEKEEKSDNSDDDFSDLHKSNPNVAPLSLNINEGKDVSDDTEKEEKSNYSDDDFSDLHKSNPNVAPLSLNINEGKDVSDDTEKECDAEFDKIINFLKDDEEEEEFSDLRKPEKSNTAIQPLSLTTPTKKPSLDAFMDEDDDDDFSDLKKSDKKPVEPISLSLTTPTNKPSLEEFEDDDDDDFSDLRKPEKAQHEIEPLTLTTPTNKPSLDAFEDDDDDDDDFSDLRKPENSPRNVQTLTLTTPTKKAALEEFNDEDDDDDDDFSDLRKPENSPRNVQTLTLTTPTKKAALEEFNDEDDDDDDFSDLRKPEKAKEPVSLSLTTQTNKPSLESFEDDNDDDFSDLRKPEKSNEPLTLTIPNGKPSIDAFKDDDDDDFADLKKEKDATGKDKHRKSLELMAEDDKDFDETGNFFSDDDDDNFLTPKIYSPPKPSNDPNLLKLADHQDIDDIFEDTDDESPLSIIPNESKNPLAETIPRGKHFVVPPKKTSSKFKKTKRFGTMKPGAFRPQMLINPKVKSSLEDDSFESTEVNIADIIKSVPDDIKKSPETPIVFDRGHTFNYKRLVSGLKKHNKIMSNEEMNVPVKPIEDEQINELFTNF